MQVTSAFVVKLGKFRVITLGSLVHGGPYVAIMLKEQRVGYFLFSGVESIHYKKKHESFEEAKKLVDTWFTDDSNFNLAANVWNAMNIGVQVTIKATKKKGDKK